MKKVLVVLALCVPFAAMLAVNIQPSPVVEVAAPSESSALMLEMFELSYDETSPVPFGFKMKAGNPMAFEFTPGDFGSDMYPFTVDSACYVPMGWADDPDNWDAACYLVFFGPGAEPGTELGRKQVSAYEQGNWNWFYVGDLGITINSGSFYFAVENKVDDNPGMTLDGGSPQHHVSWMYTVFQGEIDPKWAEFDDIDAGLGVNLGDSVDLILRVKGMAPGGTGIVELTPHKAELTPSATIVASGGTINYALAEATDVQISLWDALGRPVKTLYTGHADAGEHTLTWDASALPSGAYFIRLKTLNTVSTAKVVLID